MSEKKIPTPQEMPEDREPTAEELAEMKRLQEQMHAYYKEQLPLLELQASYEKILADISEHRLREAAARIRMSQLLAGPPPQPKEQTQPDPEKKRELKKA